VSPEPTREDRYALYQHAHHDLWWAKNQQWSVANWALLLIAGITGVARTLFSDALVLPNTWPFIALVAFVAIIAGAYLGSLHAEIAHNRDVYRALEDTTGITELRKQIPQRATRESDHTRGIQIPFAMVLGLAVASGLAAWVLGATPSFSTYVGAVVAITDIAFVGGAV
jgi:membrane protein YdbS with pleckstrin-like domain